MPKDPGSKNSAGVEAGLHGPVKTIDNPPTGSVSEALSNAKKQVDKAK